MATVSVYRHGVSMGTAGVSRVRSDSEHESLNSDYLDKLESEVLANTDEVGGRTGKKRSIITGWSSGVARRHVKWLYSVSTEESDLTGYGYAVTLTSRDFPDSAEKYHALRNAYIRRLKRMGRFVRLHWVIEWQRRGAPHLHMAIYFEEKLGSKDELSLLTAWLEICQKNGLKALLQSQDMKDIQGTRGWLQYLSKHSGRSAAHYQRMGMPPGWKKSGRLWGHNGNWVTDEANKIALTHEESVIFRRLIDSYLLHEAKNSGDLRRAKYLKYRRRKEKDLYLSSIKGFSDWCPEYVAIRFIEQAIVNNLLANGVPETRAREHAFARMEFLEQM